jgi:hypothetical protein
MHACLARTLEAFDHLPLAREHRDWYAEALRQRTDRDHSGAGEAEASQCAAARPSVRSTTGSVSKNSYGLGIVHNQLPTEVSSDFEVAGDWCVSGAAGAETIADDYRSVARVQVSRQKLAQGANVVVWEASDPGPASRCSLNAPARDRINTIIHINRHLIRSQHPEEIPEEMQGRRPESGLFAALEICEGGGNDGRAG